MYSIMSDLNLLEPLLNDPRIITSDQVEVLDVYRFS